MAPPSPLTQSDSDSSLQSTVSSTLVALKYLELLHPTSVSTLSSSKHILLPKHVTNSRGLPVSHEKELLILLDTLAACLSPTPRDRYAVSLRRDQKPVIILAKLGIISCNDISRTVKLFELLKSNRDYNSREIALTTRVLPFLVGTIGPSLNSKISSLRTAMEQVEWSRVVQIYTVRAAFTHPLGSAGLGGRGAIRRVFPRAGDDYALLVPNDSDVVVSVYQFTLLLVKMISNLTQLPFCREGSAERVPDTDWKKRLDELAATKFRILVFYCRVFLHSDIMKFLLDRGTLYLPKKKILAVVHGMEEILLFTDGVLSLMDRLNWIFPKGVPFQWIGDMERTGDRDKLELEMSAVKLRPSSDVFKFAFPELCASKPSGQLTKENIALQRVSAKLSQLSSFSWPPTVNPQVDPSLKILLYLESKNYKFKNSGSELRLPIGQDGPMPWCTAEWIRIYQEGHHGAACTVREISTTTPSWWGLPPSYLLTGDKRDPESVVPAVNWELFTTLQSHFRDVAIR